MAPSETASDRKGLPAWLVLLFPLVLCAPCLLLPLAALAIGAALAAFGTALGIGIVAGVLIALAGVGVAIWLYIRERRRAAACCVAPAELSGHTTMASNMSNMKERPQ